MGRWGELIYESDSALDYQLTITRLLERELAYLFSAEEVDNSGWWLARVFAVIEVMFCFEKRDFEQNYLSSLMCVRDPNRVRRWRELFVTVWDGDWGIDPENKFHTYVYDDPEYRRQHRPVVIKMLEYLESIAVFLDSSLTNVDRPVWTFAPSELPYFSTRYWKYQDDGEHIRVDRFTDNLIERLVKDIVYFLSPEKRAESCAFDVEEVWVAVDILGTLCEVYQQPPRFNQPVIQAWRESTTQIWRAFLGDETSSPYPDVLRAFDRLEAVALKYPSMEW